MPIRFRCAYCNQLMGISRRKAGTVVRCPKCAGQVVVPMPQNGEEDLPELPRQEGDFHPPDRAQGVLFEQSDFGKVFDESAGPQILHPPSVPIPAPVSLPNRAPAPRVELAEYDAVPLNPSGATPARGIFVTSGVLAVVSALIVVLMGMAFFLGLLLGRSWKQ